ncbi:MAG TPA: orotidine-5'-phosphate decarboxylase, partial [Terrimesophilobacter sp.]|nr:orotidine-5'-phosphate decarboxylase [Terrimesophilobacter sp.]
MTAPAGFGARVELALATRGRLCVGIDPHSYVLDRWSLPDTAEGVRELGLRVVDAVHGMVGIVKPQVAFFERFGAAGLAALERVLAEARGAGLVTIADAKRGDIGSTMEGYAHAWLRRGSPLEVDAVTLSPYLGVASLAPTIDFARAHDKGAFVLAATSNPEAGPLQTARMADGSTVAASIVKAIVADNAAHTEAHKRAVGDVGVVLGATVDFAEAKIELEALAGPSVTPILAPGFGTQGVAFTEVTRRFGAATEGVIVSASRAL